MTTITVPIEEYEKLLEAVNSAVFLSAKLKAKTVKDLLTCDCFHDYKSALKILVSSLHEVDIDDLYDSLISRKKSLEKGAGE